jgi:hypothetical protein
MQVIAYYVVTKTGLTVPENTDAAVTLDLTTGLL